MPLALVEKLWRRPMQAAVEDSAHWFGFRIRRELQAVRGQEAMECICQLPRPAS